MSISITTPCFRLYYNTSITEEELRKYDHITSVYPDDYDYYSDAEQGENGYYYAVWEYYPRENDVECVSGWSWEDLDGYTDGDMDETQYNKYEDILKTINMEIEYSRTDENAEVRAY